MGCLIAPSHDRLHSGVKELLGDLRRFSFGDPPSPPSVSTYISRLSSQLSLQIHRGPLRGRGHLKVALTLTIVRYATETAPSRRHLTMNGFAFASEPLHVDGLTQTQTQAPTLTSIVTLIPTNITRTKVTVTLIGP